MGLAVVLWKWSLWLQETPSQYLTIRLQELPFAFLPYDMDFAMYCYIQWTSNTLYYTHTILFSTILYYTTVHYTIHTPKYCILISSLLTLPTDTEVPKHLGNQVDNCACFYAAAVMQCVMQFAVCACHLHHPLVHHCVPSAHSPLCASAEGSGLWPGEFKPW